MDINDRIAQLGTSLDEWFDGNRETFASDDRVAQLKALISGAELSKELDRIQAKGMATLKALLKRSNSGAKQDRVASLVKGLRFGMRLAHTLHDELLDTRGQFAVVSLMTDIVHQLDEIEPGRIVLLPLLDDPNVGVRAYAGHYLITLIPDRVVPILRDIEKNEDANGAHFTAWIALTGWEYGGKQAQANK